MPITPDQAKSLRNNEKELLEVIYKEIDYRIQSTFMENVQETIIVNWAFLEAAGIDCSKITLRLLTHILNDYREAGWNVEYNSDQRGGKWLTFIEQSE